MRIEQVRPGMFSLTISGIELAALTSSAKWAVEGATGELTEEALVQLRAVLASYEASVLRMHQEKRKPTHAHQQPANEQ